MANGLTGDFDVVAQFSLGAVNRVLAAMHRGGRMPHSWSLRVDDYTHFKVTDTLAKADPVIHAVVDSFGAATTDPDRAKQAARFGARVTVSALANSAVDPPVNTPKAHSNIVSRVGAEHLSAGALFRVQHLIGLAQLQMGAPTVTLVPGSENRITVHTPVMARYIPDEGSMLIPGLLRGEFQTTIEVRQVSSSAGSFINVGLAGHSGSINFTPAWTSSPWTSPADQLASINKAVRNAMLTSFEPSSTPVPNDQFPIMRFKAMDDGSQPVLAVMLDIPGGVLAGEVLAAALFGIGSGVPDPATVSNVFLAEGDDFALAIRVDDVVRPFTDAINSVLPGPQTYENTFHIEGPHILGVSTGSYTLHTYAVVTPGSANVTLAPPDAIALEVPVHVHFYNDSSIVSAPDDFDFTITQTFEFVLDGPSVSLQPRAPVSVNLPGGIDGRIANSIRSNVTAAFDNAWSAMSGQVQNQISTKLGAQNLSKFLASLMNPTPKPGAKPVEYIAPDLNYGWYAVTPDGVVFHGSLAVPAWSRPSVTYAFRSIPMRVIGRELIPPSGEYNALNSWIPGGTITEFVWAKQSGPVLHDDFNSFLYHEPDPGGIAQLCLTVKGNRISASGPVTYQPVEAHYCGWLSRFSAWSGSLRAFDERPANWPKIALTQAAASGGIEVVGHASPWPPPGTRPEHSANLIVHFPDERSLRDLALLTRALEQSERSEAATAIVVVLSPDQAPKAQPHPGIVFADDFAAWARMFGVHEPPDTIILGSHGDIVWRHHGELTPEDLKTALRQYLVEGARSAPQPLESEVRVGHPLPNFFFEAAGRDLTLRKLAGQPVVVVFWNSHSRVSIEAVRHLERAFSGTGVRPPTILAVNDGEAEDAAKEAADRHEITAVVVPDPEREIARACGINLWPTTIFVDSEGLVSSIRYGRFARETMSPEPRSQSAAD